MACVCVCVGLQIAAKFSKAQCWDKICYLIFISIVHTEKTPKFELSKFLKIYFFIFEYLAEYFHYVTLNWRIQKASKHWLHFKCTNWFLESAYFSMIFIRLTFWYLVVLRKLECVKRWGCIIFMALYKWSYQYILFF